jgi:preprotein translocase subunit YajC
MMGPSIGDILIGLLPLVLFVGLFVFIALVMQRQARALERIASVLEKKP